MTAFPPRRWGWRLTAYQEGFEDLAPWLRPWVLRRASRNPGPWSGPPGHYVPPGPSSDHCLAVACSAISSASWWPYVCRLFVRAGQAAFPEREHPVNPHADRVLKARV
jgi:hypothetical protein